MSSMDRHMSRRPGPEDARICKPDATALHARPSRLEGCEGALRDVEEESVHQCRQMLGHIGRP